jgi:hypothetical protein
MENYNGSNATQSGDINLVSALMACAIPLKKNCPLDLINSESNGRQYARFSLEPASDDGKHTSQACVEHWTGIKKLVDSHPFAEICTFIAARPVNSMSISDWLDYAVDYLKARGIELPGLRGISDIPMFVSRFPSNPESYILAFVANRKTCFDLFHTAKRSVFMENEDASVLLDIKLPRHERNEFLSRLQG